MYYLRSNARKKVVPSQQIPYMELSENASNKSLTVTLNRLPILENPSNHNRTFYIDKNGKICRKEVFDKRVCLLIGLSLFFLMFSLTYFRDSWSTYSYEAGRKVRIFSYKLSHFYASTVDDIGSFLNRQLGQNRFISTTKNSTNDGCSNAKKKKKKKICLNDIRDFVKTDFPRSVEKVQILLSKKLSFIEEQCRMVTVKPKFSDNFEHLWNSSKSIYADSLLDYASYDRGAKILAISDTKPYLEYKVNIGLLYYITGIEHFIIDPLTVCRFSTVLCKYFNRGPASVLQPWKSPGECWSFKGSHGRVIIELSERINITAITLEHIPKDLATCSDIHSAPKRFSIIGIDDLESIEFTARYPLGTYEYRLSEGNIQTFLLSKHYSSYAYKIIEFIVESNHGNKNYTCVYKLRVHGHL